MTPTPKKPFNWGRFSKTLSFWILVILIPVAILQFTGARGDAGAGDRLHRVPRRSSSAATSPRVTIQGGQRDRRRVHAAACASDRTRRRSKFTVQPAVADSAAESRSGCVDKDVRDRRAGSAHVGRRRSSITFLPYLLLIGFWIFLFRQMQAGGNKAFSFGKSKAKLLTRRHAQGDVRRRGRRRRGEGRAAGDHRVPEGPAEVHEARRPPAEGRAARRPAGHRQDAARQGRRR